MMTSRGQDLFCSRMVATLSFPERIRESNQLAFIVQVIDIKSSKLVLTCTKPLPNEYYKDDHSKAEN